MTMELLAKIFSTIGILSIVSCSVAVACDRSYLAAILLGVSVVVLISLLIMAVWSI